MTQETIESIRNKLLQIGASYHHKEKLETLERRYSELTMAVQPNEVYKKAELVAIKEAPKYPTKKEVEEAIRPYIDRGLRAHVNDEEFFFAFNEKQDSGTLKQPLEVIKRCALYLTR